MRNSNTRVVIYLIIFALFGYLFFRLFDVERKVYKSTSSDIVLQDNSLENIDPNNVSGLENMQSLELEAAE